MKLSKSKHEKIDAVSKFLGMILLAVGIDSATKGNYFTALALLSLGGLTGIAPFLIEVETEP